MNIMRAKLVKESLLTDQPSLSQIRNKIYNSKSVGFVSADVNGDNTRYDELKADLDSSGLDYYEIDGIYVIDEKNKSFEDSFMVFDIKPKELEELGTKYLQEVVSYRDNDINGRIKTTRDKNGIKEGDFFDVGKDIFRKVDTDEPGTFGSAIKGTGEYFIIRE